jgi:GR25 family glycosyltransferase involved in LPS biosynthesis
MEQFLPYNIYPYRFSAVNGYAFSLKELNDIGLKLKPDMQKGGRGIYFSNDPKTGLPMPHHESMNRVGRTYFAMNHGGIGCGLSHLSILQDALNSNYETIWILEDDIEVLKDPHILSDLIDELDRLVGKGNWDVLYTDIDRRNDDGTYMPCYSAPYPARPNYSPPNPERFAQRQSISANLRRIGARFGLHSYIVRRSGMEKILNFIKSKSYFMHLDQDIFIVPNIILYTTASDIVSNMRESPSDSANAWDLRQK